MIKQTKKPRWIRFVSKYEPLVRERVKVTTIRKARLVKNLQVGDDLVLAFGSHAGPVKIRARCTSLEQLPPHGRGLSRERLNQIAIDDGICVTSLDYMLGDGNDYMLIGFELLEG